MSKKVAIGFDDEESRRKFKMTDAAQIELSKRVDRYVKRCRAKGMNDTEIVQGLLKVVHEALSEFVSAKLVPDAMRWIVGRLRGQGLAVRWPIPK